MKTEWVDMAAGDRHWRGMDADGFSAKRLESLNLLAGDALKRDDLPLTTPPLQ